MFNSGFTDTVTKHFNIKASGWKNSIDKNSTSPPTDCSPVDFGCTTEIPLPYTYTTNTHTTLSWPRA